MAVGAVPSRLSGHVDAGAPKLVEVPRFCFEEVAGRLVELSGCGASSVLTAAMRLVLDAQAAREPVAWIGTDESAFYPPDVAQTGVDLSSLLVVRIACKRAFRPMPAMIAVSAERLLRSGAFGLVLLDLGREPLSQPLQSRLLGLAQHHRSAVLCLTEKAATAPSLGSLVSLRVHATRNWLGEGRFACELHACKDKRRGPWSQTEVYRGPLGLR